MSDETPILQFDKLPPHTQRIMELHLIVLLFGMAAAGRGDEADTVTLHRMLYECMKAVNGNRAIRRGQTDEHVRTEWFNIGDPAQKRQLRIAVLRKALEIAEATE